MSAETFFLFILTDMLFCLLPGPATLVTVSHVLSGSLRSAWGPIVGINVGNFIWYAFSAVGLIALAATSPNLFTALRCVGIVYLVLMGIAMISAKGNGVSRPKAMRSRREGFMRGFGSGLAVHMSNPKALLFYTAFLPQFIDPAHPIGIQILILAIITIFTETTGLILYAVVAARTARLAIRSGKQHFLGRIAGTVLLIVAGAMLFVNK